MNWYVHDDGTSRYAVAVMQSDVKPGERMLVAEVFNPEQTGRDEMLRRARLIAAAPDLLAALQAVDEAANSDEDGNLDRLVFKIIERAIAKAVKP